MSPTSSRTSKASNVHMAHDEDEDIARAIALSLQNLASSERQVIDLVTDSEDDDDLTSQAPIQKSSVLSKSVTEHAFSSKLHQPQPQQELHASSSSPFLLERAQLEKERLQRQKRLRPDVLSSKRLKRDDDDEIREPDEPPSKRQRNGFSNSVRADTAYDDSSTSSGQKKDTMPSQSSSGSITDTGQMFWNGELRHTATQYAEPRKDGKSTFRLTEVLGQKSDLKFAIMSSYALEFSWIYEFFDRSVPVIMVAQPDSSGDASLKNVLPNWIKTTPFLPAGRGCMHMKFMLLFYKTGRLRVVISTANLVPHDWRYMENTVWLQDIPLRSKPTPHDPKAPQDFSNVLQNMLHALNIQPALKTLIKDNHPELPLKTIEELRMLWDWSKVKVHLVPSIAGRHEGWPRVIKTGHPRLMQAIRDLGMRLDKNNRSNMLHLEYQGSSLGSYTTQWLNEFHWSARGESAEDWLDEPKKKREKLPYPPVDIVFPTKATVQQSKLGEQGGGTIFCRRKQWAAKNFPKQCFCDSRSKGGPVLMHSKMIIAIFKERMGNKSAEESETEDESDDEIKEIQPAAGWAYVGSHNFTPSAWGNMSGSAFNPVLNIANYEVGIVFPLKDKESIELVACFERPPRRYLAGKDEPWIQEESVYHQDV